MTSLKRKKDFKSLFENGRWITPRASDIKIRAQGGNQLQTAIAIPRKAGNAVRRNRARRQIREILRNFEITLRLRGQFVLILSKKFVENEFERKQEELREIFNRFMARHSRSISH